MTESAYDRELDQIEADLAAGNITQKERNEAVRELERSFRMAAIDRARLAYDHEIEW